MAPFSEQLLVEAAGVPINLVTLTGACTAGELSLASDSLPFGTVVLGSRTYKRLALENTGDVGVRFAWDAKALAPHFTISPTGVCAWVQTRKGARIELTIPTKYVLKPSFLIECDSLNAHPQMASSPRAPMSSLRSSSSPPSWTPTSVSSAHAAGEAGFVPSLQLGRSQKHGGGAQLPRLCCDHYPHQPLATRRNLQ